MLFHTQCFIRATHCNFLIKKTGLENRHKSGPAESDFRIPSYITQTTCRFLGPAFWTQEITKLTHCFWCVICLCFRTITSIGQDPFVIITRSNFELQKLPKFSIRVSQISTQRSKSTCSAISDPTPRFKSKSTATPRFCSYYYTLQLQDSKVALIWYPRKSNINAKIQK